jgi:hypothetical protein
MDREELSKQYAQLTADFHQGKFSWSEYKKKVEPINKLLEEICDD